MKNQIYPVAYTVMPIKKTRELNVAVKDEDEKREKSEEDEVEEDIAL